VIFSVLVEGILGFGKSQKQPAEPQKKQISNKDRLPEFFWLVSEVRSAPPEFAADLLIRIAESKQITDVKWRKELLVDAFGVASGAQQSVRRVMTGPYPVDTSAGYLGKALTQQLDALSLRCRAIEALLTVDKAKARELFAEITPLEFEPVQCQDGLAYDLSPFYKTVRALIQTGFTPQEVRQNEQVRFLESQVYSMTSPSRVAPLAEIIVSADLKQASKARLVDLFSIQLAKISGDDRSFSHWKSAVAREVLKLIELCKTQGIPTTDLIRALRTYYVTHLSAKRCSDTIRSPGQTTSQIREINQFNSRVRLLAEKQIPPIEEHEAKPARLDPGVTVYHYWTSPKSRELLMNFKRLRFASERTEFTPEQKDTTEWKAALSDFLVQLRDWSPEADVSQEAHLNQKCSLFEGTIDLLPMGLERDQVIKDYVDFLGVFDLARGSRIEWFLHVNSLYRKARLDRPDGQSKLLGLLAISKNRILYLYGQLWKEFSNK
jgi:hypothetical protein